MIKISGIYEKGIIRPLKKLPLRNRQKVELIIENPKSKVVLTKAIIHVSNQFGKIIAESPQLSPSGG